VLCANFGRFLLGPEFNIPCPGGPITFVTLLVLPWQIRCFPFSPSRMIPQPGSPAHDSNSVCAPHSTATSRPKPICCPAISNNQLNSGTSFMCVHSCWATDVGRYTECNTGISLARLAEPRQDHPLVARIRATYTLQAAAETPRRAKTCNAGGPGAGPMQNGSPL
jgi:hypothetical protein